MGQLDVNTATNANVNTHFYLIAAHFREVFRKVPNAAAFGGSVCDVSEGDDGDAKMTSNGQFYLNCL